MSKRRYDTDSNRLDKATSTKIGSFLYDRPGKTADNDSRDNASRDLMASTIINGRKMTRAITHYSILRDLYKCDNGRKMADILMLMSISDRGIGRLGAEGILKGQLPKEIEIETSTM